VLVALRRPVVKDPVAARAAEGEDEVVGHVLTPEQRNTAGYDLRRAAARALDLYALQGRQFPPGSRWHGITSVAAGSKRCTRALQFLHESLDLLGAAVARLRPRVKPPPVEAAPPELVSAPATATSHPQPLPA
jgi:hypothetical protein